MRCWWLIILLVVSGNLSIYAQSRGDKAFDRGDYLTAVKIYTKELEDLGEEDSDKKELLKMRVANCFFHLNDVVRAGQIYKKVNPDLLSAEDLCYYAVTLIRSGEYNAAKEQIELAESLGADAVLVEKVRQTCDFAATMVKETPVYSATKMNVDFKGFSSGITYYKKGVVLAAPGQGEDALKDSRGYRTTRFYNAVFTGNGTNGRLLPFANELVDKYHIGAATFTSDYKRIYYTKTILKKDGTSILKLMTAEENGGKWENIQELSVNSDEYSCAHPTLFRDSLLFFVSDMPGGIGGKDVYMVEVDGVDCGEIQNLGEVVNTMYDELFPFMADDRNLYFASNGHVGLGGLDVFVSHWNEDGSWSAPRNMGRPINSSMDDFGLVFRNIERKDGYVSSNRGGTGYNDFLFMLKRLPEKTKVDKVLAQEQERGEVQTVVPEKDLLKVDYRYAIQVGAFRNPVPRVYFEYFKNVKVYLGYDNIYRYAVGEYPDEQLASMDLPLVKKEVKDAFVMSVDKYVAEKKIQHDVKGDNISDDELLLRRLKNFEKMSKAKKASALPAPKTLDKPRAHEVEIADNGYTVVLMSADKVFDPNEFKGIKDVDVFAISRGKYMYCTGLFKTVEEAKTALYKAQEMGFKNAYILRRKGGEFYSAPTVGNVSRRNSEDLKDILSN